ncbi:uncharacterized protein METZ01_LOCUS44012 [marine metagenome]|uniref:Uncharacterized protein n=1 Tax=marine metagenome TaxID=408172 RepID=A0A381RJM1_9ZZZZ
MHLAGESVDGGLAHELLDHDDTVATEVERFNALGAGCEERFRDAFG